MFRYSDLDASNLRFQEFNDEAARNRVFKESLQFRPANQTRWFTQLNTRFNAWLAVWRCLVQDQFSRSLFPGLRRLAVAQNPCLCAPRLCTD
jgi:hypothetical protein